MDIPFQGLIDKIDNYRVKLGSNERKLFGILTAWYAVDLSETYLDVIPKDILVIIKRMVSVYVRLVEREDTGEFRPFCLIPNCGCEPQLVGKFVGNEVRFKLTCVKCFDVYYTYNKMVSCDKCGGRFYVEREKNHKVFMYHGRRCEFSFVVDVFTRVLCCCDIWPGECQFIETLNGKNTRKLINSHVYKSERMEDIESITTSHGVYNRI